MPCFFCLQSAFICVYVSCIVFRHVMHSFTCYSNRAIWYQVENLMSEKLKLKFRILPLLFNRKMVLQLHNPISRMFDLLIITGNSLFYVRILMIWRNSWILCSNDWKEFMIFMFGWFEKFMNFVLLLLFYEFIACNRICCTVIMLVLSYFEWKILNRIVFDNIMLFVSYFGKLTSLINLQCHVGYLGLPHQLSLTMISPITAFCMILKRLWLNLLVKNIVGWLTK